MAGDDPAGVGAVDDGGGESVGRQRPKRDAVEKSGKYLTDDVVKALRVRKVSKAGKVKVVKDNTASESPEDDDFRYNDLYVLETRLDSGVRVDIAIRKKPKTITK